MVAFNKFQQFVADSMHGVHKLNTDSLKVMLTDVAPLATNAVKADLTEITAGNGYSAGGAALTVTASSHASGTYKLVADDVTITAAGGSIGPFRYAVIYNDTPTAPADPLICYWDRGSSVTLADGDSLSIDLSQANGIFQLT